ncbi:MAG: SDR family oxidoreductase [Candidatus Omnitrophica bacterium]|nr:SDR family oxidoreductase [Candidatus Omnitrophota bacterium]
MNKTVLVTGASSGIGCEFARILAQHRYDLVLTARTQSKLEAMAQDLRRLHGVKVTTIACDLSQGDSSQLIYDQVKKQGLTIDILINNAGIGDWGYFIDSNLQKQEQMLQLNVIALTTLTRLFLPEMVLRRQGKIVNVASTAAFQPGPLMAAYFATKAYVLSFSSAIGYELKGSGVTVTCLCPGPTATQFQEITFPKDLRLTHGRELPTAYEVAEYGYQAMLRGEAVAVYGFFNRWMVFWARFLPLGLILRLVHYMQDAKD